MKNPRVLLTGIRAPVSVDYISVLLKQGCDVRLAESIGKPIGKLGYPDLPFFQHPSPRHDSVEFSRFVRAFVESEKIDRVICLCEEIFYFSKVLFHIPGLVWGNNHDDLVKLHDKWSFIQALKSNGFETPETVLLGGDQPAKSWFYKPRCSRFGLGAILKRPSMEASEQWIAQEHLSGRFICTFSIFNHGKLTHHVTYDSILTISNAAVSLQSVDVPEVVNLVRQYGESLELHGQFGFDFCETSKGILPLECNPRATSGFHFLKAFDPDFFENFESKAKVVPEGMKIAVTLPSLLALALNPFKCAEFWKAIKVGGRLRHQGVAALSILAKSWRDQQSYLESSMNDMVWEDPSRKVFDLEKLAN